MRAATEVNKVTLTVEANGLISGNAGNNLSFVFLANPLKEFNCLIALPLFTSNTVICFSQFSHARSIASRSSGVKARSKAKS